MPAGINRRSTRIWARDCPVMFSKILPRTWKLTFEYEYSVPGAKWKLFVRSRA
jgi:hypothetical protein